MANHARDITGQKFNSLTAMRRLGRKGNATMWECMCDCGNLSEVALANLTSGRTLSCLKCFRKRNDPLHGMTDDYKRRYRAMRDAFQMTLARCYNKHNKDYKSYGGRGITVCSQWRESFDNVVADMGLRPDGMTLERKDNDGPYSPENCVWATRAEQSRNTRKVVTLTHEGVTRPLSEWSEITGVATKTLRARMWAGYESKDVLSKPVKCGERLPGMVYWDGKSYRQPKEKQHA